MAHGPLVYIIITVITLISLGKLKRMALYGIFLLYLLQVVYPAGMYWFRFVSIVTIFNCTLYFLEP